MVFMRLYHATDTRGGEGILRDQCFKCGTDGYAGAAIYFSSSISAACHKWRSGQGGLPEWLITCEVDLGRLVCKGAGEVRSQPAGYDSVRISRYGQQTGTYAVYDPTRIRIIDFENASNHSGMRMMTRYQPMVAKLLEAAGICEETNYHMITIPIESNNSNLISQVSSTIATKGLQPETIDGEWLGAFEDRMTLAGHYHSNGILRSFNIMQGCQVINGVYSKDNTMLIFCEQNQIRLCEYHMATLTPDGEWYRGDLQKHGVFNSFRDAGTIRMRRTPAGIESQVKKSGEADYGPIALLTWSLDWLPISQLGEASKEIHLPANLRIKARKSNAKSILVQSTNETAAMPSPITSSSMDVHFTRQQEDETPEIDRLQTAVEPGIAKPVAAVVLTGKRVRRKTKTPSPEEEGSPELHDKINKHVETKNRLKVNAKKSSGSISSAKISSKRPASNAMLLKRPAAKRR